MDQKRNFKEPIRNRQCHVFAPTDTQKQRDFMEPMRNKLVTKLPGVGETLGARLSDAGYQKASQVYGQYLALDQNKEEFNNWMKRTCNANKSQSSECFKCLDEWNNHFN
ncbi:hypothetical protein KR215_001733 [Drosophila sulfurigaster]|nr:hypothetical protein KR215_001733 [Drosophila sulfurigaster]